MQSLARKINNLLGITAIGQKTMANSLPVVIASDQGALPIGRSLASAKISAAVVSADPTVSYTAGDVVGSKLTVNSGGTYFCLLKNISIAISGSYSGTLAMSVIIFDSNPGSTMLDDFQYALSGDAAYVVGVVSIPSTAFQTNITGGVVGSVNNIDLVVPAGTIYAVIIADAVFDPGADQLSIRFGLETD